LIIRAVIISQNGHHTRINVFQNGGLAGTLCVDCWAAPGLLLALNTIFAGPPDDSLNPDIAEVNQ
jgi:hypothetical protein